MPLCQSVMSSCHDGSDNFPPQLYNMGSLLFEATPSRTRSMDQSETTTCYYEDLMHLQVVADEEKEEEMIEQDQADIVDDDQHHDQHQHSVMTITKASAATSTAASTTLAAAAVASSPRHRCLMESSNEEEEDDGETDEEDVVAATPPSQKQESKKALMMLSLTQPSPCQVQDCLMLNGVDANNEQNPDQCHHFAVTDEGDVEVEFVSIAARIDDTCSLFDIMDDEDDHDLIVDDDNSCLMMTPTGPPRVDRRAASFPSHIPFPTLTESHSEDDEEDDQEEEGNGDSKDEGEAIRCDQEMTTRVAHATCQNPSVSESATGRQSLAQTPTNADPSPQAQTPSPTQPCTPPQHASLATVPSPCAPSQHDFLTTPPAQPQTPPSISCIDQALLVAPHTPARDTSHRQRQEDVLQTFQRQWDADSEQKRVTAAVAVSIDAILQSMRKHTTVARVQRYGCGTLQKLAVQSEFNRNLIIKARGVHAIMDAMRHHPQSVRVQESGCSVLASLVKAAGATAVIVQDNNNDGIPTILQSMQNHLHQTEIQKQGCLCLLALACSQVEYNAQIAQAGGIGVIMQAIRLHSSDTNIREYGTAALWSLSYMNSNLNQTAIEEAGGLDAIFELLSYSNDSAGGAAVGCPESTTATATALVPACLSTSSTIGCNKSLEDHCLQLVESHESDEALDSSKQTKQSHHQMLGPPIQGGGGGLHGSSVDAILSVFVRPLQ